MRLRTLFDLSLSLRAGVVGLEHDAHAYTFGDLALRADRMAAALIRRGVRPGDRLAIYLANRPEWIELYIAAVSLGVIPVPINILYRDREVAHIVHDADPVAIVSDGAIAGSGSTPVWDITSLCSDEAADEKSSTTSDTAARDGGRERSTWIAPSGDTPALIVYTSGTTGRPKGAVLTHDNLAANAANLVACWAITAEDRLLLTLPLFHVHGLGNGLHTWLLAGCRLRLETRFDHTAAPGWFLQFQPTVFFGVPTMYTRMLDWPADECRSIGASARLFVSGSAPLPASVLDGFEARFGHRILERYGMTETLMTLGNPLAGERRSGSVGVPFPGVAVRIVRPGGRGVDEHEVGELLVKGRTVFSGYWRAEDATRAAFTADGWFHTGDLAEQSRDGYVTLRGRASDVIISGGFNIYPREIEEFLMEQPEIGDAAVVAIEDALRGEVPVAFVVPSEGSVVDPEALIARCRVHLASFKVPRRCTIVPMLPRNALGKVQKHLLREAGSAGSNGEAVGLSPE